MALLLVGAPTAMASHEDMSTSDCLEEFGHYWPEANDIVVESESEYDHVVRFTFEIDHDELEALECVEGNHFQIDFWVNSEAQIEWGDSISSIDADFDYMWLHHENYGSALYASFRGFEVSELSTHDEYEIELNVRSEHPLDSDQLDVSADWVPIVWRVADYDGECGGTYVHYGDEICLEEVDRVTLDYHSSYT